MKLFNKSEVNYFCEKPTYLIKCFIFSGWLCLYIKMVLKNMMIVSCFFIGSVFCNPIHRIYIPELHLFCIVSVSIGIWSFLLLTSEQLFVVPVAAEFGAISLLKAFADPHFPVFATPGTHPFSLFPYVFILTKLSYLSQQSQLLLVLVLRASLLLACFIIFA